MHLDHATFEKLIGLLTPLMQSEQERRALLTRALVESSALENIEYAGATQTFIPLLIKHLVAYGEIEPGKQALWALLETVRSQVGVDKQRCIDALRHKVKVNSLKEAATALIDEGKVGWRISMISPPVRNGGRYRWHEPAIRQWLRESQRRKGGDPNVSTYEIQGKVEPASVNLTVDVEITTDRTYPQASVEIRNNNKWWCILYLHDNLPPAEFTITLKDANGHERDKMKFNIA